MKIKVEHGFILRERATDDLWLAEVSEDRPEWRISALDGRVREFRATPVPPNVGWGGEFESDEYVGLRHATLVPIRGVVEITGHSETAVRRRIKAWALQTDRSPSRTYLMDFWGYLKRCYAEGVRINPPSGYHYPVRAAMSDIVAAAKAKAKRPLTEAEAATLVHATGRTDVPIGTRLIAAGILLERGVETNAKAPRAMTSKELREALSKLEERMSKLEGSR